jgi:FixJ family two-component response regulator
MSITSASRSTSRGLAASAPSEATPIVHVVDDNESLRALLHMLFTLAGYKVASWDSAECFLRDFDPNTRGCLVSDIQLPGMSGIDLGRKLAQDGTRLPLILMSGRGDLLISARGLGIEPVALFAKPFENSELLNAVEQALDAEQSAH